MVQPVESLMKLAQTSTNPVTIASAGMRAVLLCTAEDSDSKLKLIAEDSTLPEKVRSSAGIGLIRIYVRNERAQQLLDLSTNQFVPQKVRSAALETYKKLMETTAQRYRFRLTNPLASNGVLSSGSVRHPKSKARSNLTDQRSKLKK